MTLPSRRTVLAAFTTGAMGLTLAACGQKVSGATQATEAASGSTVDYWTSWPADTPQAKIFAEAAKEFQAESGVTIKIRTLGQTGRQDIINAAATGSGPDMFDSAPDHVPVFRERDLIADLNPILDAQIYGEDATVRSVFVEPVLKSSSDNQGQGFIPHTILSGGIWFDAAKQPELASNAPQTWDDLVKFMTEAKAQGQIPIAQEGGNSSYNILWFYWLMLRSAGAGSILNLGQDASAWDDPRVLEAAKQVAMLREKNFFQKGYEGSRYPNAQNAWAQGDYVLDNNGSWLAGEVKAVAPSSAKLSTFAFPEFGDSSQPVAELNTLGWCVSSKAKNAAGAQQFIIFLVNKKWADKIGTDALNIPARKDAVAPESLQAMQKNVLEATQTTGYMDNAPAKIPAWFKDTMLPLSDQLIFGQVTPEQFVGQGKSKTEEFLKSNK
ncbi:ABC transporter substrate-binding protein [Haematomicrobium sanguinis]|uniref:ABC transporter substrate-binding protein n=1 Tax=Haematomicrobium sanguinis TaxID=479106 RepID=UPI0012FBBF61|nr:extracellular solute-binding protein [Haematomicrobium sanguinis]